MMLADRLGGDIDGAWWPYTASVAQELPELIESLHTPLGEIIDICINWSLTDGPLDLHTLTNGKPSMVAAKRRRPRLMFIDGRDACAKLLVVPHMTPQCLGALVMRGAAAMSGIEFNPDDESEVTADLVLRTAQVESAEWAIRMRGERQPANRSS